MNIRVAIVDDDDSVCRSLGRLLGVIGMEAVVFPSAEAFVAHAEPAEFDCLLLDIQLGGMSGLELHARLRSGGYEVPVIFITAHDDAASRREAASLGCAGFLRKTDPGTRIIEAIRSGMAQRARLEDPSADGSHPPAR
jgi:FixJ family two-component response regulator